MNKTPSHQNAPRQQKGKDGEYRDLSPVSDRSIRENDWRER